MRQGMRFLTRPITVRYYIAILLTGLVVSASYIFMAHSLQSERELFEIVDLSKLQREAVDSASNLASLMIVDKSQRELRNEELRREIRAIEQRNRILGLRDSQYEIPPRMQAILREAYYAGPLPLDSRMTTYLHVLGAVAGSRENAVNADRNLRFLSEIKEPLIQGYRQLTRSLRTEAIAGLDRIRLWAALLWGLTIAILAVEVPLIFRPMVRHAAKALGRIEQARREAEEQAAAAEAARKGQSSFIRTMSHELRTPLNGILGMAQLLMMRSLPPKEEEYVNDIHAAGEHLLELINSILEFSRLEAGHISIECRPGALKETIDQTVSLMQPLARQKSLTLDSSWDSRLSPYYLLDSARIREVLLNLIGNAVKFTHHGSVHVRVTHAGIAGPEDYVRFEVKDTGIGVPEKCKALIFDEFQQVDNSLARKFGGTGLGLAICQRLIRLMDGEIGVESVEGRGSVFWFALPLERVDIPETEVDQSAAPETEVTTN